jgi:hypothetical protein
MRSGLNAMFRIQTCRGLAAGRREWKLCVVAGLAVLMSAACLAQDGTAAGEGFHPEKTNTVTPVNQLPDVLALRAINSKRVQQRKYEAANLERKRQMSEDAAHLLEIAQALNSEVGNAAQSLLPRAAIVKAEVIERLAHSVKEKMKLTAAAP